MSVSAHLTHEPEPFGGIVFVSRANHAAASHCGSHPGSEPTVSCAWVGGALAAVARIEASLPMDGQESAKELNRSRGRALRGVARPVAYSGERLRG